MTNKERNEIKYVISSSEFSSLRPFISAYLKTDKNAVAGSYTVRSLYFDSIDNEDLHDNLQGNEIKKKIRLRHYEGSNKYVLEIKHKNGQKGHKEQVDLTRDESMEIMKGNFSLLRDKGQLGFKMYYLMSTKVYRPRSIIVYDREPYVFEVDNTRVTFDSNVKATEIYSTFFDERISSLAPTLDPQLGVLEIKYDNELIAVLQEAIKKLNIHPVANSKYTLARLVEY